MVHFSKLKQIEENFGRIGFVHRIIAFPFLHKNCTITVTRRGTADEGVVLLPGGKRRARNCRPQVDRDCTAFALKMVSTLAPRMVTSLVYKQTLRISNIWWHLGTWIATVHFNLQHWWGTGVQSHSERRFNFRSRFWKGYYSWKREIKLNWVQTQPWRCKESNSTNLYCTKH